jgi:hypothetical protein
MSDLDELPRMQFHRFSPWDVDPNVCQQCGQLPQAHPGPSVSDAELAHLAPATEPRGSQAGDGGPVEGGGDVMVWAGANYPQEYLEDDDTWNCDEYGHEYQLLTRHADPPGRAVLSNAVCAHCSEHTWINLDDDVIDI